MILPAPSTGLVLAVLTAAASAQTTVFTTDFEGGMPAEITPGTAQITGVQGYSGLGPTTSQFAGSFLRSETGNIVTLTVTGLPTHDQLHLDVLFAAIDSLDGTGTYPSGDYFKITVDGNQVFREAFANALPSQTQTYVPPAGVELARHQNLGFTVGTYHLDSAYYFGGDPYLASIAHTAATATIEFVMEGPGIQPLADESWAVDNLRLHASTTSTGTIAAYGTGCGPVLGGTGIPSIGQTLTLDMTNLPSNSVLAFAAIGFSNVTFGTYVLPLPLDPWGANGCWLVTGLSLTPSYALALSGTTATATMVFPNNPAYVGLQLFNQGWVIAPGANTVGILFSNGLRIHVGP